MSPNGQSTAANVRSEMDGPAKRPEKTSDLGGVEEENPRLKSGCTVSFVRAQTRSSAQLFGEILRLAGTPCSVTGGKPSA